MAKQGFGKRIADAREAAGLSQKALMEKLGWPNDSNARLSGYENEAREPSLADFRAIARVCKADPAHLAFGEHRLDPEDADLIQKFAHASEDTQRIVRAALRLTARNNKQKAVE